MWPNQKGKKMDGMPEAFESLDMAIANVSKSIKNGSSSYSEYIGPEIDDNIERLEKLIVIRAAMSQLYATPETETSEPDENSEPETDPLHDPEASVG